MHAHHRRPGVVYLLLSFGNLFTGCAMFRVHRALSISSGDTLGFLRRCTLRMALTTPRDKTGSFCMLPCCPQNVPGAQTGLLRSVRVSAEACAFYFMEAFVDALSSVDQPMLCNACVLRARDCIAGKGLHAGEGLSGAQAASLGSMEYALSRALLVTSTQWFARRLAPIAGRITTLAVQSGDERLGEAAIELSRISQAAKHSSADTVNNDAELKGR